MYVKYIYFSLGYTNQVLLCSQSLSFMMHLEMLYIGTYLHHMIYVLVVL